MKYIMAKELDNILLKMALDELKIATLARIVEEVH